MGGGSRPKANAKDNLDNLLFLAAGCWVILSVKSKHIKYKFTNQIPSNIRVPGAYHNFSAVGLVGSKHFAVFSDPTKQEQIAALLPGLSLGRAAPSPAKNTAFFLEIVLSFFLQNSGS